MDYIPHTPQEAGEMLSVIGLEDKDQLFEMIPASLKQPKIDFPPSASEMDITSLMHQSAAQNRGSQMHSFLGGGCYHHYVPHAVGALASRGDFATAYTPYQPEASQGTLQTIFEFQTLLCRLTGMEAANASMYEGATSLAEAALMACRITRKEKIIVSDAIHANYLRVLETYMDRPGFSLEIIPSKDGVSDIGAFANAVDDDTAACFIQHPNAFGCLEQVDELNELLNDKKALFGAVVYPHSLGVLKPPGQWGADIVVGDLQSIGLPPAYGGPSAGFVACKNEYIRQLPGRLCGKTTDADGKTGYVLTLQTREQQIRRSKATSNICTNQALCALQVTIYLTLISEKGLRTAASLSVERAHVLQQKLCSIDGVALAFEQLFFNEFVLTVSKPVPDVINSLKEKGILAGIPVDVADNKKGLLVCATEMTSTTAIDAYVDALQQSL
jgi:glycine dehydrogenase subunit 1